VRGVSKLLAVAVAAVPLAVGLAACGNGNDSTSTTTAAESQGGETKGSKQAKDDSTGGSKQGSQNHKTGSGAGEKKPTGAGEAKEAGKFVPAQHSDSGGGSKQFRAPKGFDNSILDYGGETTGSELDAAAAALHNFLDARAEPNWAAACSYMSKSMVESFASLAWRSKTLEDAGCATLLETLTNKAALPLLRKEAARADVGSLRTEGDRGFIIYRGLEGSVMAMPMTNEGGTWKVSSLASTPLN
jgi:hypothetical protein